MEVHEYISWKLFLPLRERESHFFFSLSLSLIPLFVYVRELHISVSGSLSLPLTTLINCSLYAIPPTLANTSLFWRFETLLHVTDTHREKTVRGERREIERERLTWSFWTFSSTVVFDGILCMLVLGPQSRVLLQIPCLMAYIQILLLPHLPNYEIRPFEWPTMKRRK